MKIVASNSITISNVNDGTITHLAYSWSADGTDRFMTVYPRENLIRHNKFSTVNGGLVTADDGNVISISAPYSDSGKRWGAGIILESDRTNKTLVIPWGKSAIISFEIWSPIDGSWYGDINTFPTSGSNNWNGNDNDNVAKRFYYTGAQVHANTWTKCGYSITNDNNLNTQKVSIYDYSGIGIQTLDPNQTINYKIRNLKYEIVDLIDNVKDVTSKVTPYTPSPLEDFEGAYPKFIGTYTDYTTDGSTDPSKYTWSKMLGEQGKQGERGKQVFKSSYEDTPNGVGYYWTDLSPAVSVDNPPKIGDTIITPAGNIFQITSVIVGGGGGGGSFGVGNILGNIKGANGNDGIAGKDGKGINLTTITYAINSSGTVTPTTGWNSQVPTLVKGQYLWTKTVWRYTDNSTETGYSVSYIAQDGNNGTNGIAGKDGVGLVNTTLRYAKSTDGVNKPSGVVVANFPNEIKPNWSSIDNNITTDLKVRLEQGKTYILSAETNGMFTNQHNTSQSSDNATIWLVNPSFSIWALISDNNTANGTRYTHNSPTGEYNIRVNGYKTDNSTWVKNIVFEDGTWSPDIPTVNPGEYLWTRTTWFYSDGTSEQGFSVAKMGEQGPKGDTGHDGDPGKVVSDTEPTTRFKGLTWKYSGTADLTASDGTVIHPNTEYYYNGTHWVINYFSVNNFAAESITSDKIDGKNLTITDGEFVSTTTNGPVTTSTEIKDNHIAISKTDGTVNTRNDIALDSEQGLAQKFTNIDTGFYRTAGINYQGPFTSDSDGNYAQLTPQGTKLSTDVPWTKLSLMNNFTGNIEYAIINGTVYISASGVGVPAMTAGQWKQAAQLPTGSSAIPVRANRIAAGDSGDGLSWALLSNQAGGIFIRCSANKAATANLFNATLPYPIG